MLGSERPHVSEVGVDLSYATAVVPVPAHARPAWKMVATLPDPPRLALAAGLLPMEGNRWIVVLADGRTDARLETWENFLAKLRELTTPTLYNALRHTRPSEAIRHYRFLGSRWRHFERLPGLPRGILPIADAFCRFNPIRGQGMASAAKQARLLQSVLAEAATKPDPLAAAQAGFMAEVESVLRTPWNMSTSTDLAYPETRGERPPDFEKSRQFEAALFRAVAADPVVHRALLEVAQLLQPLELLHEPHIMERIEACSAKALA